MAEAGGPYRNQHRLPRLPVPTLEETVGRYLRWVKPLVGPEAYTETAEAAQQLLKDPEQGPRLQSLLEEYDKELAAKYDPSHDSSAPAGEFSTEESRYGSYIEEFWNDAYLVPDDSVVLNLNPFFLLADDPTPSRSEQPVRAASLVYSSLKFISSLQRGELQPDEWRGTPLCMAQFRRMFGSARIPQHDRDSIKTASKPTHLAVLCRNQFYFFDCLWPTGELGITEEQIEANIRTIIAEASDTDNDATEAGDPDKVPTAGMGVLTTEPRKQWAEHREQLAALSANNRVVLDVIDSALFVLCLDDEKTGSLSQTCANVLHGSYLLSANGDQQLGSCTNRWYDKHQIIVDGCGSAGVNFEHSAVDGHTMLRFTSDVFADTIVRFAQSITATTHGKNYLHPVLPISYKQPTATDGPRIQPRKLRWDVDAGICRAVHHAEVAISDQIMQNEVVALDFKGFGKKWIVKHKMSPDSFAQMSMIAAYIILYGSNPTTYEAVMTKGFLHGRTEAGRSCIEEIAAFARLWTVGIDGDCATLQQKQEGCRSAVKAHSTMIRDCAKGKGVDRHFYALRAMATKHGVPMPALFSTSAYSTFSTIVLSTSNCGNPALRMFGFGPVCPQGFGIGYIIKDYGIAFCVSSKHRQTSRYVHTLQRFLHNIVETFDPYTETQHVPEYTTDTTVNNTVDTDEYGGYFGDAADMSADAPARQLSAAGERVSTNPEQRRSSSGV